MKVLFLTYDVPYPLISGGKVRAYHLIKNLAQKHKITLFSYYRDEEQRQYLPELKKYCQKIFLFKRGKPWRWQTILKSLFSRLPFASAIYFSNEFKSALEKELGSVHYDLVHFESYYPALWLPIVKKYKIKTILGNENIEYLVYQKFAKQQFNLLKWILGVEIFKMEHHEENLWRIADINLAPSLKEAKLIEGITGKPCPVVPNGVDIKSFYLPQKVINRNTIIFIGTLIYQANADAVNYFLSKIYPQIKLKFPRVKFLLVSWHKPNWLDRYLKDSSIKFIQDKETPVTEFLKRADVLVAPMRVAGGTRIKILEAMAAGLPVVTTSIGIEGIEAKDGREVIVVDKPDDFANEVVELLINKNQRQKLSLAARQLVEKKYDWSSIAQKLEKVYQENIYG